MKNSILDSRVGIGGNREMSQASKVNKEGGGQRAKEGSLATQEMGIFQNYNSQSLGCNFIS